MNGDYGPHRPEDAPTTVLAPVLAPGARFPRFLEVPRPAALVEQRRQLNTRAHYRALERRAVLELLGEAAVNIGCLAGLVLVPLLILVKGISA